MKDEREIVPARRRIGKMKDEREIATVSTPPEVLNLPELPEEKKMQEVYEANFGDSGMTPSFETIKVPTGGGLTWTIPDDTEEGESAKELYGVIIDHYRCRAYWPGDYQGGNALPDCSSLDGKTGTKYGACATCQFSQWGTGKEGRGQACKSMMRCYVLLKGAYSILPYLLSLPPTSAPDGKRSGGYAGSLPTYASKLLGRSKKLHEVLTKIKLVRHEGGKYTYSKVQFFFAADLSENEKRTANFLREKLGAAMRQKEFETTEYASEETNGHEGPQPWDEKQ